MGDLGFGGSYSSDDDEEYVIEKIVDERGTGKKKEYLVKFKDYGDEDNTWTTTEDEAQNSSRNMKIKRNHNRTVMMTMKNLLLKKLLMSGEQARKRNIWSNLRIMEMMTILGQAKMM